MSVHVPADHAKRIGLPDSTPSKYLKAIETQARGGLVVHEIYASIQGESTYAGRPCSFVRLTACHLRCRYCDTPHAFGQGQWMSRESVIASLRDLDIPLIELTGGEPLLQAESIPLMRELCDAGYEVMLETSGSLDIRPVDTRVKRIGDLKTPSSGELAANRWDNLDALTEHDEIKFVLGDRGDYEWARDVVRRYAVHERCPVLFSCVFDCLSPETLVSWLVEDRLPVRFQLQLHKVGWDPKARGV